MEREAGSYGGLFIPPKIAIGAGQGKSMLEVPVSFNSGYKRSPDDYLGLDT